MLDFINFYIIPGLVSGSIYACGAIGVTLIFSLLRYAHLAHGDMATFSAFLAYFCVSFFGLSLWQALIATKAITALLALMIHRLFYDHLKLKPKIITVMASLGVALMLRSVVQVVWGTDPITYVHGIVRSESYFGLMLKPREIATLATCLIAMVSLGLFLKHTKWGKAMRANANNPDLASLCGVNSRLITTLTWVIVAVMVSLMGFFLGLNTELKSMMGWSILLPVFAAAILGGVGRIGGAIVGGLIIGLGEELAVLILPASYKAAVAFAVLIVMLLIRPQGLFKGKVL